MSATDSQLDFVNRLYAERDVPGEVKDLVAAKALVLAPRDFSKVIDIVKGLPKVHRQPLPVLEPGTYQDGNIIFRVQVSRESNRPYAKVWDGSRWAYDRDAYRNHAANAQEVPLERAVAIGVATGHCVCCARDLSDPVSVEAGIGPRCVERYNTTREAIIRERQLSAV